MNTTGTADRHVLKLSDPVYYLLMKGMVNAFKFIFILLDNLIYM